MFSTTEELAGSETYEESQDTESTPLAGTESPVAAPDSTPPRGAQRRNRKVASSKKDRAKRQKTYCDPSPMLPPINQKGSTVCVGLLNLSLWQQFSSLGTEMLVNKRGRRMFPSIDITVTGLNPNASYIMIMDVVAVGNWRYKYVEQKWVVSRQSTVAPFTDYYVHPKSPALGADWMEQDISFGDMKLTNLEETSEGMIRVHTMHCYHPRLHIVEGDNVNDIVNSERTPIFLLPATYFFAVTSYMNGKVIDLKVKYNKYAKRFINTCEAVTEGRMLGKGSVSGCSSSSVDEGASPCASHNVQEVQPRPPTLLPRGVVACQTPSDMQRYTPDAFAMNRTDLQLTGLGQNCISVPNGSLLLLSPMQQLLLPGPAMHADLPGQKQNTPPGCNTPTPSFVALYPPGNCSSWPPLGSTALQPLPHHVNDYSEYVSPLIDIQTTDAVVDVPSLGEDIESTSSGMQSPFIKGSSGVSLMEGRGGPCTPLCLPASQPMAGSEPVVNGDTSVTPNPNHSQLHHYNLHSSLPSRNSFSSIQHWPHSCPVTSTTDYSPQTKPLVQPPLMYNLHTEKTALLGMQGGGVEQCELSVSSSEEAESHTSASSPLSQWAFPMIEVCGDEVSTLGDASLWTSSN